jgi:hypothetical protein
MEIKKQTKTEYYTDLSEEEIDELAEKHSINGKYRLHFVDYNEWLTKKEIERYLRDYQDLREEIESNFAMQEVEMIADTIDEIERKFDYPFTEDTRFALDEAISDRKIGDPLDDLVRNTPSAFFYYDTGYEIDPPQMLDEDERAENEEFLTRFGLSLEESKELLANAFYGGQLVILFRDAPRHFFDDIDKKDGIIAIKDGSVCVMDRENGSGHDIKTDKQIVLPYKKERLHCDAGAGGYDYSESVCGLAGDAYDSKVTIS